MKPTAAMSLAWCLWTLVACGGGPGTGNAGSSSSSGSTGDPDAGLADAGGGDTFWAAAGPYNPAGSPTPANGRHNAGRDCQDCHDSLGMRTWLFGGTLYTASGAAAAHVQVGLKDATQFFSAYSASNGNFWIPQGSATVDWATAEVRVRNATAERTMSGEPAAPCNSCHSGASILRAP